MRPDKQIGYVNRDRQPNETCSCDVFALDPHGLSAARRKEICAVLNGFDIDADKGLINDPRKKKLDYMRSLDGEERLFTLHWIRYQ